MPIWLITIGRIAWAPVSALGGFLAYDVVGNLWGYLFGHRTAAGNRNTPKGQASFLDLKNKAGKGSRIFFEAIVGIIYVPLLAFGGAKVFDFFWERTAAPAGRFFEKYALYVWLSVAALAFYIVYLRKGKL